MKKLGEIRGIPVYVDPNAPPATLYFINDKYMNFKQADKSFSALAKKIDNSSVSAKYTHMYHATYGSERRTHTCVLWGRWCWRQILRHPIQSYEQWRRKR